MARSIHKLSALAASKATKPGHYSDGGGLSLQITKAGVKSWLFRFMLDGRAREMGLGPFHTVTLAEARTKAADCRKLLLDKIDPIEARSAQLAAANVKATKAFTFDECAEKYIAAHSAGWKNAKHVSQWENTLSTYCSPVFGSQSVDAVDTGLVMTVLEPIWNVKTETATRLRGRIESVLDWATVRGFRNGDNPARWRGHLDSLLPAPTKVRAVVHHPALPFDAMYRFLTALRKEEGTAALALEFLILTVARTGEVVGAKWGEFDLPHARWTVPADRMKANREHAVPLCPRAVEIVRQLEATSTGGYVFSGRFEGKPMSNMAMLQLLKRMERTDIVPHGFRSTFRDWAAERTAYAREVVEQALAHTIGDKVEAAYRRGDLFAKRRRLMNDWQKHCETKRYPAAKVVSLQDRA